MTSEEGSKDLEEFLEAMAANSQITYDNSKLALLALLANFTRETHIRAGHEKTERAFKMSEKILEALPQDLSGDEFALIFSGILFVHLIDKFAGTAEAIRKAIKEAELKNTSALYA